MFSQKLHYLHSISYSLIHIYSKFILNVLSIILHVTSLKLNAYGILCVLVEG